MLLLEIFEPAQIQWITNPDDQSPDAEAKLVVNGNEYFVGFEYDAYDTQIADVFFELKKANGSMSTDIENTGSAAAVFGGVMEAIRQYVRVVKPWAIRFTAKEESRTNLYRRMIDRALPGCDVKERKTGKGITVFTVQLMSSPKPMRYHDPYAEP